MKDAFPDKLILANFQIAHAGELEDNMAFGAGADYITILGATRDVKAAKSTW
jgi:3-hexulose-6-phosphate synthase